MNVKNAQEYDNPTLYDIENDSYLPELALLEKWARIQGGPIVDLACGTGRVTIPLAKKGFTVIGVDIHPKMLLQAKEKAISQELNINWVEQDCTKLHLSQKCNFIFSVGNSFQHFLTNEEQDGFLASVSKHLKRGGVFIFGTRFPSKEELMQPTTKEFWKSYIDSGTQQKVDLFTISDYDALTQIQHYITIRNFHNQVGELTHEQRTTISLRYTYPQEMKRLLDQHGFEMVALYQDWNETPITSESYEMIYVVRKK
ncbi:Glycine/sarcosine N-methyltransferase [Bacillus sp. THAF10]|uniref:class I SAM-dependent methyltransferase n=1 Tax=Bacillus sp. THAF10 TaxID=2587848 RepID=UPI0012686186|nr:class I SAM-dependent methyltransferase [Bacillus sp. THAF10]QFT90736.1 Glycine/sarcosine N-methyltransferase [Bacillus sp. THAF10]